MKKKYIHTTYGVRNPQPIQVTTLTSESGNMMLTITLDELADYENRTLGYVGAFNDLFPQSINDNAFGVILKELRDDGILEREWINE
jgi:hypothetical protein